jgi:hypothetical protein
MGIKILITASVIGLIFFIFILRNITKKNFNPSYSILWFCVSLFLLSIPIFEPFYRWFSIYVIGIIDARHIIYIFLIGFLLVYTFFLTSKITKMSNQIQRLISTIAILEERIDKDKEI